MKVGLGGLEIHYGRQSSKGVGELKQWVCLGPWRGGGFLKGEGRVIVDQRGML